MTTTAEMIGVVGGGLLARMMVEAAAARQVAVAVQTASADDPACAGASRQVRADPRDVSGTRQLVVGCQGITFENEWVNNDALIPLEQQGSVPDLPLPLSLLWSTSCLSGSCCLISPSPRHRGAL